MSKTVLVGVDGSDTSRRAAQRAAEVAKAMGMSLCIVVAVDDHMSEGVPGIGGHPSTPGEVADRIAQDVADDITGVSDVQTIVSSSDPADALVEEAERLGAELIVVGNRGVRGLGRLLGSVSSSVVTHAPCDVYVVKTV